MELEEILTVIQLYAPSSQNSNSILIITTVVPQKHGMVFQAVLLLILRKLYVSMSMITKFYHAKGKMQHLMFFWGKLQSSLQIFCCITKFQSIEPYRNLESLL